MRGKLRDKHATTKHDVFKREIVDRKRVIKRDTRLTPWLNQEIEEQEDELVEEEGEAETAITVLPQTQKI
jgi:hypothetical protein